MLHTCHFLPSADNWSLRDNARMSRTTAKFSISLPPEMMAILDEVMTDEHRTRSELVREALRQYFNARAHFRLPR
jgi:predicted DNA-binding protein